MNYKEADFDRVKALYNLSKELKLSDVYSLLKTTKQSFYKRGDCIIREGSTLEKRSYFIFKGLVRCYKKNEKGEKITTLLKWENQVFLSHDIVFFNQPSQFYFEAVEPTTVLSIDYDLVDEIVIQKPKLEAIARKVVLEVLKDFKKRLDSFILLSPEERYLDFMKSHAPIINRVPDKYIAHLLGITPVSLSRIRQRITNDKK